MNSLDGQKKNEERNIKSTETNIQKEIDNRIKNEKQTEIKQILGMGSLEQHIINRTKKKNRLDKNTEEKKNGKEVEQIMVELDLNECK
jgi:hypothetical protein